jgi:hypothetical protein
MLKFLERLFRRRTDDPERMVVVDCDDELLWVKEPKKPEASLAWDDLEGVAIQTNDSGPFGADVWWLLGHAKGVLAFPNGATGVQKVLQVMQDRLSTFDNARLIEAQTCVDNRTFIIWDSRGRHRAEAG